MILRIYLKTCRYFGFSFLIRSSLLLLFNGNFIKRSFSVALFSAQQFISANLSARKEFCVLL